MSESESTVGSECSTYTRLQNTLVEMLELSHKSKNYTEHCRWFHISYRTRPSKVLYWHSLGQNVTPHEPYTSQIARFVTNLPRNDIRELRYSKHVFVVCIKPKQRETVCLLKSNKRSRTSLPWYSKFSLDVRFEDDVKEKQRSWSSLLLYRKHCWS